MNRPRAVSLKPRKSPQQARSAVTVAAIHTATIQVLLAEGSSRLTTTRVALRAAQGREGAAIELLARDGDVEIVVRR